MKYVLIALGILVMASPCLGQNASFVADMEHALALEDTASTATSVIAAAHHLEQLTLKYPDEWLGHYWAAFVYTQVGLFTGQDERLGAYLDLAQAYHDKAWTLWTALEEQPQSERADFFVLQAFIYSWQSRAVNNKASEDQYNLLRETFLEKTEEANPDNAMLWMMRGLPLLPAEETREEGVRISKAAQEKYTMPRRSSIHPNWGKNFIGYWLSRYAPDAQ